MTRDMSATPLPIVGIDWPEAHRITTERAPIPLFEAALDPEELDILREQLDAVGEIDLNRVPPHRPGSALLPANLITSMAGDPLLDAPRPSAR